MPIYGLATFPGIEKILEASISVGHGITPAVALLTISPQNHFTSEVGTLTFTDGNNYITLDQCRVDTNSFERNKSGLIWRLAIYDRRWMWTARGGGGAISGWYNLRNDDGTMIGETEQAPQDLAKLCFEAMGVDNYDVSALPNDSRPTVQWDYALPAECLSQLCEHLGCRVVPGSDDQVKICVLGQGQDLPITPDIESNSLSMTIGGKPDNITVVCDKTQFQVDFPLEAVGREADGRLVPIDQLSYRPAGGWTTDIPGFWDNIEDDNYRALAVESVYRYYRIAVPVTIPGYSTDWGGDDSQITALWRIKLLEYQNEVADDKPAQGNKNNPASLNLPPVVGGLWFDENTAAGDENVNSMIDPTEVTKKGKHHSEWRLNAHDHCIAFSKPIYANKPAGAQIVSVPATLYLRAVCEIVDDQTFSPVRYERNRSTGSNYGTPTRYHAANELRETVIASYKSANLVAGVSPGPVLEITGYTFNTDTLDPQLDAILSGLEKEYEVPTPQIITYAGIKPVELDGAVQHVRYSVGHAGCTTTISRNTEQLDAMRSYEERRLIERLKDGLKVCDKAAVMLGHGRHRGRL